MFDDPLNPEPRKSLRYFDICDILHSELLRCVIDLNDYRPSKEQVVSILKQFAPEAANRGISIGIETHDRFSYRDYVL